MGPVSVPKNMSIKELKRCFEAIDKAKDDAFDAVQLRFKGQKVTDSMISAAVHEEIDKNMAKFPKKWQAVEKKMRSEIAAHYATGSYRGWN